MTQKFFTVLTHTGAAAISNALALGRDVVVTRFAVGDGGGPEFDPTVEEMKASTDLVNSCYDGAINQLKVDENNPARYFIEGIVPVDVGGWTVREAGWYLENGDLFAITKYPPSYKSVLSDGAATELPVRTYVATGAVDNIQLKIDPTIVLATRQYVGTEIAEFSKIILLDGDNQLKVGRKHRFLSPSNQLLPVAQDGCQMSFLVDWSVDLNTGDCLLSAPDGETIKMRDGNHSAVLIKTIDEELTLTRIGGMWKV